MLHDPEEATAVSEPASSELPADLSLGAVQLVVADLERSVAYWEGTVGLSVHERSDGHVVLGCGPAALVDLCELPGARPADGYSGLYHVALLVPERRDLACWLAHAARDRVPMAGLSDHFVSEALYLRDPDHHGIEIYWDRPRELWEGKVGERMTTFPLDVDDLFGELDDPDSEPFGGLPDGTVVGHVHLCVADVPEAVAFYRDVVGFDAMAELGGHAAFLSAGGYHHHLGANSWESAGRRQPPEGTARMKRWAINLPDADALEQIVARLVDAGIETERIAGDVHFRDPSGNAVVVRLRAAV